MNSRQLKVLISEILLEEKKKKRKKKKQEEEESTASFEDLETVNLNLSCDEIFLSLFLILYFFLVFVSIFCIISSFPLFLVCIDLVL